MPSRELNIEIELTAAEMLQNKNLDEYVFQKAKRLYEKRCYDRIYILEVKKLVWMGDVVIISFNLSANGKVCITILVSYIQYTHLDFAICKVNMIRSNGNLVGSNSFMQVEVRPTNPIYKIGREIPIIVRACRYHLNARSFATHAIDFCPVDYPVMEMQINESERKLADFSETDELEGRLKEIGKGALREKFDNMISYKKLGKPAGKLRDFNPKANYIVKMSAVPSVDDNYYQDAGESKIYETFDFYEVHTMLVANYNKSLRNMITLLEHYDDSKFAADADIWKLYNLNKRK